jgi:glycosyltransferase involved in cell wall biosynthesis
MNLVDCVVVPSKHSAALLASLGVRADRIEIIPYGVNANVGSLDDDASAVYAAMHRARSEGRLVLACVGTIGARKNQGLLLAALARLGSDVPVFCVFIGDGDSAGLQVSIAQAGVEDRTLVHGYSPAARCLAAAADVLVLPSRSEGQPLALLEAFCDGPLVLVSDIPELAELVQDGRNGFQFAADNAESLAQCLRSLSAAPVSFRQSVQDRARATYLQHFTGQAMIDAYTELYGAMCVSMAWQAGVVPAA